MKVILSFFLFFILIQISFAQQLNIHTNRGTDVYNLSEIDSITFTLQPVALDSGLIAYYPFNGNANDESGNGNHGEVIGAVLTSDRFGNPQSAYSFDGVDDYIDTGNSSKLKPPLPMTFALWVMYLSPGSRFLTTNFNDTSYFGIWSGINPTTGLLSINYGDGGRIGPPSRRSLAIPAPPAEQWFHLVGVIRDAIDMEIYINGESVNGTYSGYGGSITYSNSSMNIGRVDSDYNGPPRYMQGKLDQIRLYNRALTYQEIQELFLSGN